MRVLFVEISLKGHRVGYLKTLVENCKHSIALLPENSDEVECKQVIMKSGFDKLQDYKSYLKWIREISELAEREKVDFIHFLCGDVLYRYWGLGLSKIKKMKIVTFHHMKFDFVRSISIKQIFRRIECGVVHTESLNKSLQELSINNSVKIEYPVFNKKLDIKKEIARVSLGLPQDARVMVTLGGTQRYKGIDILLEAMDKVTEPFYLIMTGVTRDISEKYIIEKVEPYKDRVKLNLSRLTDEEFSQTIIAADILLLPYRFEFDGASGPMVEGAWYRKYIIGASHGSMGGLIRRYELGSTFETENADDLARVINKILSGDIVWSEKAELFRENLTVDKFLESYNSLYTQYKN